VQQLQGQELVGLLAAETDPVLLSGDFNSAADGSTTTTYADLGAAGYADPWPLLRPRTAGFTCCFSEDLRSGALTSRIDLTLARNGPRPWLTFRVGSLPWERTRSGLWPSDHAGVVTLFQLR
jgi:endonuclease/exonuclease/phosphatase (EEP) superfamily protein YafD